MLKKVAQNVLNENETRFLGLKEKTSKNPHPKIIQLKNVIRKDILCKIALPVAVCLQANVRNRFPRCTQALDNCQEPCQAYRYRTIIINVFLRMYVPFIQAQELGPFI